MYLWPVARTHFIWHWFQTNKHKVVIKMHAFLTDMVRDNNAKDLRLFLVVNEIKRVFFHGTLLILDHIHYLLKRKNSLFFHILFISIYAQNAKNTVNYHKTSLGNLIDIHVPLQWTVPGPQMIPRIMKIWFLYHTLGNISYALLKKA